MPTPPPTRIARAPGAGAVNGAPERPERSTARSPAPSSHRRRVPGPTSSSRNCDAPSSWRATEKAREQERPLVLSSAPPLGRREHRELAGRGRVLAGDA